MTYPWKKNLADSLSRQFVSDALVRKGSVKDANAEYVHKLQVRETATDQEIQGALHQLFKSVRSPQGSIISTNEDTGPQGTEARPSIIAAISISRIQFDNGFKNSLHSYLQHEIPYAEILKGLLGGTRQVKKNNLIFKRNNGLLFVHDQNQEVYIDFWRIVVPDNFEVKEQIVRELHNTPYSAHPGIQRTIAKVRRSFYWKGMLGDVRQFVENCPVCQTEKPDHTLAKRKLQSTQILGRSCIDNALQFIGKLTLSALECRFPLKGFCTRWRARNG